MQNQLDGFVAAYPGEERRCNSLSFIASSNAFVRPSKHRAVRSCASSNRRLNPIGQLDNPRTFERARVRRAILARHTSRGRRHVRARAMLRASSRRRAPLRVDGVELEEISGVGDRRERARRRGVCGRESVRMRECARVEHRREMLDRARVGDGARWTRAGFAASSSDASAAAPRGSVCDLDESPWARSCRRRRR